MFLRKIVPGGADRSYGIEVAKLAGLPDAVLKRAREILRELESQSAHPHAAPVQDDQLSLGTMAESAVADVIRRTQVDALSPLEALNLLYEQIERLCPPCMTAGPCCRAGPACPTGKHAYRAAGHMGPALQDGRDKPPVGDGVFDVPSCGSAAL